MNSVPVSGDNKKLLVLIMGRSGAGITSAVKAMQDIGLFVIDNLPLNMIEATIETMEKEDNNLSQSAYAIGVHGYSVPSEEKLARVKERLSENFLIDVVFLKAKTEVLAKRFTTTRRPHPLRAEEEDLLSSIERERKQLRGIEKMADLVINTTELNPHVLARYLEARYAGHTPKRKLLISISSFGFKHQASPAFDLVFDVRFMKNPYFVEELRHKTGKDDEVANYVRSDERYPEFSGKILDLLEFLLPQYYEEGKVYLRVGIGCTGGKHRSVTFARDLYRHLKEKELSFAHVTIDHLDSHKK